MIRFLMAILFGLLPMSLAFQTDDMADQINKAIEAGNARNIARHFGPNLELFVPGSEGTFSRSQSELILRNFFAKNIPEKLTINRQGSSRDGSIYVIATLKIKDGSYYRVYYLIKKVSDTYFLSQLQIDGR